MRLPSAPPAWRALQPAAATATLDAKDPIIQLKVDYPQNVAVPPKGQTSSPIYSGTVNLIQHIGGTTLQSELMDVYFNVMPWYQVQYQRDDETFMVRMGVTAS